VKLDLRSSVINDELTFANCCKERSVNLPIVTVNCFCDLIIRNSRIRVSLGARSYHRDSYAASPIILLWNRSRSLKQQTENRQWNCCNKVPGHICLPWYLNIRRRSKRWTLLNWWRCKTKDISLAWRNPDRLWSTATSKLHRNRLGFFISVRLCTKYK